MKTFRNDKLDRDPPFLAKFFPQKVNFGKSVNYKIFLCFEENFFFKSIKYFKALWNF